MKCFTIVLPIYGNVLPNGQIGRNPSAMFYCLDPHKQGMMPEGLCPATPEASGKGAEKKAEMMPVLADMGAREKKIN